MSSSNVDNDIPQWKRELIARLRNQNKRTATAASQQLCSPQRTSAPVGSAVQQPGRGETVAVKKCNAPQQVKMVQERTWERSVETAENGDHKSDSDEDLRYGPGIVNKLRNKYLSLAQRESATKARASILPMRKAASLENILDDDVPRVPDNPSFVKLNGSTDKHVPKRYRNPARGSDMKRARSVETISRGEEQERPKREEMLIEAGNEKTTNVSYDKMPEKTYSPRNRPKRIAPIMNEREKPPVDVVKQAKMFFERRPEQRTKRPQQTGDVAAKVATYKTIIGQNKVKKPPIKVKPVGLNDKPKTNGVLPKIKQELEIVRPKSPEKTPSLPSPIPDVSRIDIKTISENGPKNTSLSETPDLIMTSSPLPSVNSPSFRISATENFIKEERRLSNDDCHRKSIDDTDEGVKKLATPFNAPNTMTFNFAKTNNKNNQLPTNRNVSNTQTSPLQPLKLELNGIGNVETKKSPRIDNDVRSPLLGSPKANLTNLEIEKNLINAAKTLEQPKSTSVSITSVDEVTPKIKKVPKVKKQPRELENNSIVFKFTDRKDVPNYVHNDGTTRVAKIEKPKVGEGGIIILPGASIDESFTDEDEELMRSLEGPPSPCDVTFINDNILIDGKSSLSQKTKKAKMKISFVEAGPEIYEYPSESSMIEDVPTSPLSAQIRSTVPSVTGSTSLGNYTPKSTEAFQPGVTRSVQNISPKTEHTESNDSTNGLILEEVEEPVLFSAGANSDILF